MASLAVLLLAAAAAGTMASPNTQPAEAPTDFATGGPVITRDSAAAVPASSMPAPDRPPAPDLEFRRLDPGEVLGEMTVSIAAAGERIERPFLADSRTDVERRTQPIDPDDPMLSAGFMLDAAWALPQLREEVDPATGFPVMSIIAVHRNTRVPDVDGVLTTMHNIDLIAAGDVIEIELVDGSRQVWTATGAHEFLAADETFGELAVDLQTATPRMLVYACDSTEGVPDPGLGTYTPDLRRFVLFELTELDDPPLPPDIDRLR